MTLFFNLIFAVSLLVLLDTDDCQVQYKTLQGHKYIYIKKDTSSRLTMLRHVVKENPSVLIPCLTLPEGRKSSTVFLIAKSARIIK